MSDDLFDLFEIASRVWEASHGSSLHMLIVSSHTAISQLPPHNQSTATPQSVSSRPTIIMEGAAATRLGGEERRERNLDVISADGDDAPRELRLELTYHMWYSAAP